MPKMTSPSAFEQQMNEVREDVREVRGSISKIAEAITRMAVLEERHRGTDDRLGKMEERVRDVEKKASENEKSHLKLMATIGGITLTSKALWVVVGATVAAVVVRLFSAYAGA